MRKKVSVFLLSLILHHQSAWAETLPDFSTIVKENADAVVAVHVSKNQSPNDAGLGTGFVISEDGYILTNAHVVAEAEQIHVQFQKQPELIATVIGFDNASDIGLIKVNASGLRKVTIGSVPALEVGQSVVAIGFPFNLGQTVTKGIVSAKNRTVLNKGNVPFIQTDASMNMGNSGGPLFNDQGQVVGVNAWIYSPNGNYAGMSFSIPIDLAMDVVARLKKLYSVPRESHSAPHGWLGIRTKEVSVVGPFMILQGAHGALISSFALPSPAKEAGLREGDIVIGLNQQRVESSADLKSKAKEIPVNAWVSFDIIRQGERRTIRVKARQK